MIDTIRFKLYFNCLITTIFVYYILKAIVFADSLLASTQKSTETLRHQNLHFMLNFDSR